MCFRDRLKADDENNNFKEKSRITKWSLIMLKKSLLVSPDQRIQKIFFKYPELCK